MHRLKWWLQCLALLFIFQEILLEVDTARVRVVKVKKTRHDKRQAQRAFSGDLGQDDFNSNSPSLRPEDNPYNAGNRKVEYPLLSNNNNDNNQNRNFQAQPLQQQPQQQRRQQQRPSGGSKTYDSGDDHCDGCGNGIPGEAGTDYPTYTALPQTNFDCKKQQWPGYYADVDARCQVFWICQKNRADAFLCPNGTLFNQQVFVCDWWFNVDCGTATEFYSRNQYIYGGPGIDLFGNQVPIHNRQSTAAGGASNAAVNNVNNVNRARPPTNRPPAAVNNYQRQSITHAQTTVIPLPFTDHNQQQLESFGNQGRQPGFQIPIVQTTTENYVPPTQEAPTHYNRRATQHFSPSNTVNNNGHTATKGQFVATNQGSGYLPERNGGDYGRSSAANNGGYSSGNNFNSNAGNIGNNFNPNAGNHGADSGDISDGGTSYATYIDAQKRLHLGANYKHKGSSNNKSYHQNPLLTSTTSRSISHPQQGGYQGQSYAVKSSRSPTQQSNYAGKNGGGGGYGNNGASRGGYNNGDGVGYSTTKRNAISLEDLDESSSNVGAPQDGHDDDQIYDEDGMKFNFAKTVVPTTTPVPPLPRHTTPVTQIVKLRKHSYNPTTVPTTTTTMLPTPYDALPSVTTHRPYSRHVLKSAKKASWVALDKGEGHTSSVATSTSVSVPLTYIQVPPFADDQSEAPPPTTAATPQAASNFGKKIKSGKKRNTSNWTSYFHKN